MIKNLQILRAIAAMLVVFFHCDFLNVKIGQFGVDIFFVISGFIISFVLNRTKQHFLIKRFIRVVPMYYLFTIALVCIWAFFPEAFKTVQISASSIVKSLCFIPYYLGGSGPILSLGWTLNYEIYFYVTVGIFAVIFRKPSVALILAAFVILMIILFSVLSDSNNFYILFYSYQITIEFIYGIALYYITQWYSDILQNRRFIVIACVLAVLSFILLGYLDYNKIYDNRALGFGIPAFFIVLFFIMSENVTDSDNFLHKLLYKLGNASYVVYLCHPFVIYFILREIAPLFPASFMFSFLELVLMISAVILVSIWTHQKIELPIVKFLERLLHRAKEQNN